MISVERHLLTAGRVTLELRVAGVDREDLVGVGGLVQPVSGGDHLVVWEWSVAMAPPNAVEICTRHVQDVLTTAALAWLGGGAVVDLTGGPQDG